LSVPDRDQFDRAELFAPWLCWSILPVQGRRYELDSPVFRIIADLKTERRYQVEHPGVLAQYQALDAFEVAISCDLHEIAHQMMGNSFALPLVRNSQCKFAALFVQVGHVTGNTNLFFASVIRPHGNQGHLIVIVDLRKANQHFLAELLQRTHETKIPRFAGEVAHEFRLNLGVFRPNRSNHNIGAVIQLDVLDQVSRVGMDGEMMIGIR
jgi:hypothetical protein